MNVMSSPTNTTSRRDSRNSHAPSRVEKPRSTHNSPTGLGRRKTTTTAVKRYVTLEDRWDMVFGASEPQPAEDAQLSSRSNMTSSSRPVSWHPLSSDAFGFDSTEKSNSDSTFPSPASGYASAPAMAYLTALAERKKEQYSVPGLSTTEPSVDSSYLGCQDQHMPDLTYTAPNHSSRAPPTSDPRIESGSTEFLPESADYMDSESKDSGDVLVGMGLYDPPNYESMLTTGFGKGLKLEETWQPPEDAEDESSDDESDEPSEEQSSTAPTKSTSQQYWSPPTTQQTITSGSDGILGADESMYMNEWWYQQLKRPTAHATGLGYGWLQQAQY